MLNRSGFWALPASGLASLRLGSATAYGSWWADLELVGPSGTRRLLLCRDQLTGPDWRALELALRRAGPGQDLS